ncbi:YbhB/YbcL family Raf kinase inhibitor-like protein [Actinokineospora xionganensis]|nr:YbhB/YbcL family Raf kinase inhibitor-like protein [Actinokineospora xionganensis]
MPQPGSHKYDVKRTRLRADRERQGVPDDQADEAANEELQQDDAPAELAPTSLSKGTRSMDDPLPENVIELRSAAFTDHTLIPNRFAHDGDNASPPLQWTPPPEGTQELVLVCEDKDAPDGTFVHWVATGISPDVNELPEGKLPDGVTQGRNSWGGTGWDGPAPPVGDDPHRYFFRLYAVDEPLGLGADATAEQVHDAVRGHKLAAATLVGLFGR